MSLQFFRFSAHSTEALGCLQVNRRCGYAVVFPRTLQLIVRLPFLLTDFMSVAITGEKGQNIGLKGISRFEMTDGAAACPQEAVYCSDSPDLTVQFESREGTGCVTFLNLTEVELREQVGCPGLQLL